MENLKLSGPTLEMRSDGSSNYAEWSMKTKAILEAYDMWDLMQGSAKLEVKTAESEMKEESVTTPPQDKKIKAYLMVHCDSTFSSMIAGSKSSLDAWNLLQKWYSQNKPSTFSLRKQLINLKMDSMTIDQYYRKLEEICLSLQEEKIETNEESKIQIILEGLRMPTFEHIKREIESLQITGQKLSLDTTIKLLKKVESETKGSEVANSAKVKQWAPKGGKCCNFCKNQAGTFHSKPQHYSSHSEEDCRCKSKANQKDEDSELAHVASVDDRLLINDHISWYFDSGASKHMTANKSLFKDFLSTPPKNVIVGNGEVIQATEIGTILLKSISTGRTFSLSGVLYVKDITINLVSCSELTEKHGALVAIAGDVITISDSSNEVVVHAKRDTSKLYRLDVTAHHELALVTKSRPTTKINETWHRRLGHPGSKAMESTVPLVTGITLGPQQAVGVCDSCAIGKSHKLPYHTSHTKSDVPGEFLHSDIYSLGTQSFDGYKYLLIFVDDATNFTFGYLLKTKRPEELLSAFKPLCAFIKRQKDTDVKRL